jgi:hypothetical protein
MRSPAIDPPNVILIGISTDQLAISLQEIPSTNAMEMGQIMQAVGYQTFR